MLAETEKWPMTSNWCVYAMLVHLNEGKSTDNICYVVRICICKNVYLGCFNMTVK